MEKNHIINQCERKYCMNMGIDCAGSAVRACLAMKMPWDYAGTVVISGLVIVFVALILLIIAVTILGRIFTAIQEKKKPAPVPEKKIEAPAPAAPVVERTVVPEEDDGEVIAVIAAAIAAISAETGEGLRIKSIRPTERRQGRRMNAWGSAAARESIQ